jgi:hypothetical protein
MGREETEAHINEGLRLSTLAIRPRDTIAYVWVGIEG